MISTARPERIRTPDGVAREVMSQTLISHCRLANGQSQRVLHDRWRILGIVPADRHGCGRFFADFSLAKCRLRVQRPVTIIAMGLRLGIGIRVVARLTRPPPRRWTHPLFRLLQAVWSPFTAPLAAEVAFAIVATLALIAGCAPPVHLAATAVTGAVLVGANVARRLRLSVAVWRMRLGLLRKVRRLLWRSVVSGLAIVAPGFPSVAISASVTAPIAIAILIALRARSVVVAWVACLLRCALLAGRRLTLLVIVALVHLIARPKSLLLGTWTLPGTTA